MLTLICSSWWLKFSIAFREGDALEIRCFFVVYRCPVHGIYSCGLTDAKGNGWRVFGDKCCHKQYHEVAKFIVDKKNIEELVSRFNVMMEEND